MSQNEIFCPQYPSQHLNENFPVKVLALSTQNYSITDLRKIFHTIFQNNSKELGPNIVLFNQDDKAQILFGELNPEYKEKWLNLVKEVPSLVIWAQDFFEGFVSTQGTPFIRLVRGYKMGGDKNQYENYLSTQALLSDMFSKEFNIATQTPINDISNEPAKNGHKGGNIESTNEGYCLIGNSDLNEKEWDALARQNCSGPENAIKLPTDWLPANHVDELIKQLPSRNLSSCQPTFAISSPKKTMEILNLYPDERFFGSEIKTDSTYIYDRSALSGVCATGLLKRHLTEGFFISNKILATPQFAPITPREGYTIYRMPLSNEKNINLFEECTELRNKDILNLFQKDPYYAESLRIAQQKTEQSKKIIVDFYKSKRPDCMVHFIEMPTLFAVLKAQYYSEDRSKSVVVTTSEPILPNVLNNLKINQDVFVPNTGNKYINKYVRSALARFRLRTIFLDTFRLHVAGGNVHCSSQTIHQCQTLEVKRQPNSESICGRQNKKELLTETEPCLKNF